MSGSPFLDAVAPLPAPPEARWVWAVVTQSSPLRIRIDGDRDPLGITPDDLGAGARTVGQRVYCQILNRRLVVIGPANSPLPVASGGTGATTASGARTNLGVDAALALLLPAGVILEYGGSVAPSGYVMADGASYLRTDLPALFEVYGTTYGAVDGTHFNVPDKRGRVGVGRKDAVSIGTVTMTIANPVTFTLAWHGFANGQQAKFTTTGALPTGLVAGQRYYVINATEHTFQVSSSLGGAAIATSGSQSGTHTLWMADFDTLGQVGGYTSYRLLETEMPAHRHGIGTDAGNQQTRATYNYGDIVGGGGIAVNNVKAAPYSMITGDYMNLTGGSRPHLNLQPQIVLNYIIKT